jgi:hypothetical protein
MSIHTLPAGSDVLKARLAEMQANQHGKLTRLPEPAGETFRALVAKVTALGTALAALDGSVEPDPLATTTVPTGPLDPGYDLTWRALAALVQRLLAMEGRLTPLDHFVATTTPGVIENMAAEIELDGFIHRRVEAFWSSLEILVTRVLTLESRIASLTAPKPAA